MSGKNLGREGEAAAGVDDQLTRMYARLCAGALPPYVIELVDQLELDYPQAPLAAVLDEV